ncbi:MAG TPA: hypothetical protein VFH03_09160, partial [Actinoplanes sp.]|nr:hypothetical protein [Actinoplanes sp.]
MTVLPSPIPHPLDYCPWDLPGWAYEALEWVVGFQWPDGNEKETWDVADRWYALADILAGPRQESIDAADQIILGYGGTGITVDAFRATWHHLSADEQAPLNSLLAISHEIGTMVEECGCDIEGAKIEAWIELGIFVIELIGMAVAVALTLGAASPAAGGLIAATRLAIQQIFRKLVEALSKKTINKALKEAGERAAKQLTSRAGLTRLGREALDEGFDEAREEFLTNAGIQAYQNSTGRRDGMNLSELGMSTAAGFAGGFASSGASIGKNGPHGNPFSDMARGAGAEVLGELGGAAVTGQLPDLESIAKSASSGVSGAAIHTTRAEVGDALAGLKVPDLGSLPSAPPTATPSSLGTDLSSPLSLDALSHTSSSTSASSSLSAPAAPSAQSSLSSPVTSSEPPTSPSAPAGSAPPGPSTAPAADEPPSVSAPSASAPPTAP